MKKDKRFVKDQRCLSCLLSSVEEDGRETKAKESKAPVQERLPPRSHSNSIVIGGD